MLKNNEKNPENHCKLIVNLLKTLYLILKNPSTEDMRIETFPSKHLLAQTQQQEKCKMCSKSTIKTPERRHWLGSGVFIASFEHK